MQSVLCCGGFLGAEMDYISEGNEALGESADVDSVLGVELQVDKVSVTGLNGGFQY